MLEKLYSISEVAEILDCTSRTVQQYITEKRIKAVKIANRWKVNEKEIGYIQRNGLRK
jgi:excisionase family DNA binding protein